LRRLLFLFGLGFLGRRSLEACGEGPGPLGDRQRRRGGSPGNFPHLALEFQNVKIVCLGLFKARLTNYPIREVGPSANETSTQSR